MRIVRGDWAILAGDKGVGYSFIDVTISELAIAIEAEHRGHGFDRVYVKRLAAGEKADCQSAMRRLAG